MCFSKVNCFIIGLNARVYRKVFNVTISPLNATNTPQKRPHFHEVMSRLREKKTKRKPQPLQTLLLPELSLVLKQLRILELRVEGFGEAHLRDGQGEPTLLTEYSYSETWECLHKDFVQKLSKELGISCYSNLNWEMGRLALLVFTLFIPVKRVDFGYCPSDCSEKVSKIQNRERIWKPKPFYYVPCTKA